MPTPPADIAIPVHWPEAGQTRFRRITSSDGISHPNVTDIVRDQQGFMWFATANGLNLYDGYTFTIYRNMPGDRTTLDFNDLSVVYLDSENTLWVGGAGGIDRFDRETGAFTRIDEYGQVYSLMESRDGILWAGFWHGLYAYDRHTGEILQSYVSKVDARVDVQKNPQGYVRCIEEDSQGFLWIGTDSGLYRLDRTSNRFTLFTLETGSIAAPPNQVIRSVYVSPQDEIWVGTSVGLGRLDRQSGKIIVHPFKTSKSELSLDVITAILPDDNGGLWIGTLNGLVYFNPVQDQYERYLHDPKSNTSLSDNLVLRLYREANGQIWIGTENGVSIYHASNNQFQAFFDPFELAGIPPPANQSSVNFSEMKVEALLEDQKGNLWIGTRLGGLVRVNTASGEMKIFRHDPEDPLSLADNRVSAIYQDLKGTLWFGTGSGWLEQYDPAAEAFTHTTRLSARIRALNEDPAGNLWIGTSGRGVAFWQIDRGSLTMLPWMDPAQPPRSTAASSHIITTIMIDGEGAPWFGTYLGGINIRKNGLFRFYRHRADDKTSLGEDYVTTLLEDNDPDKAVVWVGTMGGGLERLDRETELFTHYTVEDGLADPIVTCLLQDYEGRLWLRTSRGLTRFDPTTGVFWNYDETDGVPGGSVVSGGCLERSDGSMLFSTPNSLIAFNPARMQTDQTIPPVAITRLIVNGELVGRNIVANFSVERPYLENNFAFEFAVLDYTFPDENTFAYQMVGVDQEWVMAGTRSRADYPSLLPGEYTFRLRGANSAGIWNQDGLSVHISILPPFWQTGWFISLAALLLLAGVYAAYRGRLWSLEQQRRSLEKQVKARTEEINQRRREIEALYQADEDLYRHLDLDQVLQALVDTAVPLLNADKGAVWGWDATKQYLVIRAAHGYAAGTTDGARLLPGQGITGNVMAGGQPAVIEKGGHAPDTTPAVVLQEGIEALVQVPIRIGTDVFGVFSVDYLKPRKFTTYEVRLLVALAQRAANAIQNAQVFEQAQELAASQERSRLANDLHDAVTQTLFSASLIAEALPLLWERSPEKGRERLEKLRQLNRGALAEMRALLLELRPNVLMDAELANLVRQLADAASGQTGAPIQVQIQGACKLPDKLHLAVYRIVQETLNNAIKHAAASKVDITLTCQDDASGRTQALDLVIADDGQGFDPAIVAPEKLGLHIMRERAQSVGAVLFVESQPGKGTRIRLTWAAGDGRTIEEVKDG